MHLTARIRNEKVYTSTEKGTCEVQYGDACDGRLSDVHLLFRVIVERRM